MVNENLINAINILTLILLFSSVTWTIVKKKYESAITLGVLLIVYIIFRFVLKTF